MTRLEEIVKNTPGGTREAFNHLVYSLAGSIKEKGMSGYVVRTLRTLYKLESLLKERHATYDEIKEMRHRQAKPILDDLKRYMDEKILNIFLKSCQTAQVLKTTKPYCRGMSKLRPFNLSKSKRSSTQFA